MPRVAATFWLCCFIAVAGPDAGAAVIECLSQVGDDLGRLEPWLEERGIEIRPSPETCTAIGIRGVINRGDAREFERLVQESRPWIMTVYLASEEGLVSEAMQIGRLVRKHLLTTWAPSEILGARLLFSPSSPARSSESPFYCWGDQCTCSSACFFVWVAGVQRLGDAIGLHRPYPHLEFSRRRPFGDVEAYREFIEEVRRYLIEMDVPEMYPGRMTRIPFGEIVFLSPHEVERDFEGYVRSAAEEFKERCGELNPSEEKVWKRLAYRSGAARGGAPPLSDVEQAMLERVSARINEIADCENASLLEERVRRQPKGLRVISRPDQPTKLKELHSLPRKPGSITSEEVYRTPPAIEEPERRPRFPGIPVAPPVVDKSLKDWDLPPASSESNYLTVTLPRGVAIELPRNWLVLSDNTRITLDAYVEAIGESTGRGRDEFPSALPFAANLYNDRGHTIGIVNLRYYPSVETTQRDVRGLSEADIEALDSVLRAEDLRLPSKLVSWDGTVPREINGLVTLVTRYRRESVLGSGTFQVRLVRVLNGSKSFTLTVSYREAEKLFLEHITDRIIASLRQR